LDPVASLHPKDGARYGADVRARVIVCTGFVILLPSSLPSRVDLRAQADPIRRWPMPRLIFSKTRGGPGAHVGVVGTNCLHPRGQPDELAWHDSYNYALDLAHRPASFRRVPVTRVSRTKVVATFVVSPSDSPGRGVLVLLCGGRGNADALFTVAGRAPAGFEPAGASFVSTRRGWALGRVGCDDCAALRMTVDGGRSWTPLPSPRAPLWFYGGQDDLRAVTDVAFADTANGFLFGPGLLVTSDGGLTWRRQSLPPIQALMLAGGHAYALTRPRAEDRMDLWRTRIGSDRWTRVSPPIAPSSWPTSVSRLQLAAEGGTVVLLQAGYNGPLGGVPQARPGPLWVSCNFGLTWRPLPAPCTRTDGGAALIGIARAHPEAWLVDCFNNEQSSQAQDTQHHLYGTADAGRSWIRLADPTRHNLPALLADNGEGHAFLATEGGRGDALVGTFDGARHWHPLLESGGSFFGWADLRFITASTGFVVGPTHYSTEHLYRTDDGGRTWRVLSIR
jgi:photosystem II stability/assembly factor-like uncharacterized protein